MASIPDLNVLKTVYLRRFFFGKMKFEAKYYLPVVWAIQHPFFLPLVSVPGFSFGLTIVPLCSFSVCALKS